VHARHLVLETLVHGRRQLVEAPVHRGGVKLTGQQVDGRLRAGDGRVGLVEA